MAASPVYLDTASAAPWHPAALATHARVARELPGDPMRRHRGGRAARDLLESARGAVATVLGTAADRLLFTSGGTEAIHLAVLGAARANRTRPRRIVSSAVEHSAVLAAARAAAELHGHEHVVVGVDAAGRVDVDALARELRDGAALVSVQHANHEVGTLQPLGDVAGLCREADALLHVDAGQTVGRLPVTLEGLGADLVSCSAAKFGGGRGIGALAWSPRARFRPIQGGRARAATPCRARGPAGHRRHGGDAPAAGVADLEIHGDAEAALPHLVAVSALYVDGEALVTALDGAGYATHSGSSCATTSGEPSHVLVAMGALTHGHIRVSFGPEVGEERLDGFVTALVDAVDALRQRRGL